MKEIDMPGRDFFSECRLEEMRYEAEVEARAEAEELAEDEYYEDEWQAHGFRDAADYRRWKGF